MYSNSVDIVNNA